MYVKTSSNVRRMQIKAGRIATTIGRDNKTIKIDFIKWNKKYDSFIRAENSIS